MLNEYKKGHTKRPTGMTLVELMLSIAVILVIISIGIMTFNNTQSAMRANKAHSQITTLIAEIKKINMLNNFNTISASVLINAGKAPKDMISSGQIRGLWGGALTITPANLGGGANNAFDVVYPKIPRAVCNDLINATAAILAEIYINGVVIKNTTTPTPAASTVAVACNNTENTIIFRGTS